jgi:PAS domain-containing protein
MQQIGAFIPLSAHFSFARSSAWCDIRIHPNEDCICVYFHDITVRHLADNAIRASEERFRKVIDMTPAGYVVTDANGILIDVNPAVALPATAGLNWLAWT